MYVCLSVYLSIYLYVCMCCDYLVWQHGEDAGEFLQHPHLEGHPLVLLAGQVASQNLVAVRLGGRG